MKLIDAMLCVRLFLNPVFKDLMMSGVLSMNVDLTDSNGEVLNSSAAKKMRRIAVKDLLSKNTVRVQYVRTPKYKQIHGPYDKDGNFVGYYETVSKGDPYGVVVSRTIDGRLYLGWSLLHRKDVGKYDRDFGIIQALSRLAPVDSYINNEKVPHDVLKKMAYVVLRAFRKGK